METIKVNMSPNPLDVQTIHASQNDSEAREWGFELHNNGDVIDSSEISDQLVFKAYKGGTEQLLPENGSTPTTSPIIADIKYPQGLLTDQEFLYRESHTEEDGLAKITDIKGNTLVWNQLVQNGNFTDTSGWSATRGTITASSNICRFTVTDINVTQVQQNRIQRSVSLTASHKYLLTASVKSPKVAVGTVGFVGLDYFPTTNLSANQVTRLSSIYTSNVTGSYGFIVGLNASSLALQDVVEISNAMLIDLTLMFGAGNEPTTVDEFTSLFPLSYYAYNQGSLLSFNGNGIKTVGKNLLPLNIMGNKAGIVYTYNNDGTISLSGTATSTITDRSPFPSSFVATLKKNVAYRVSGCPSGGSANTYKLQVWNATDNSAINTDYGSGATFTLPEDKAVAIRFVIYSGQNMDGKVLKPMITFADVNQSFEPYTSSTLSLPISTYFPNGMKSAGNVYDELLPTKAITRIGAVDLGSLDWRRNPNVNGGFNCRVADMKLGVNGQLSSVICPLYETVNTKYYGQMSAMQNMQIAQSNATQGELYLINTSYNDVTAFKTAMNGVMLYYELATPTETSFTTASLVTENAEIPLSNEDGILIGKCAEQLSENPGFIDAKIKLSDSDGDCYSNKLQLHVERSPQ